MAGIVGLMQEERYVLWNFANLLKTKKTIEFRGGRGLRGPKRTKWWIAFVVGFIDFLLDADTHNEVTDENVKWLFYSIMWRTYMIGCEGLPPDYRNLNETMA
ncbi:hypothetical protein LTR95_002537 [Oleoguttula sp. CCFEE 5521]